MPTEFKSKISEPIPITLLSGFLGSGKTTLLEHILTSSHGLKIAVIINDVSQLNIDAALVQGHKVTKKEEKLISLQNGCICCTLRGDLLEELVNLAKAGKFQYIIVESTGISEPMQVAETFTTAFSETLLQSQPNLLQHEEKVLRDIIDLGGLNSLTKLDTCVTVVDAINFLSNIETTNFLIDRYGDHGSGEKERTITDLLVDQIEFADVIIINKISAIKKKNQLKIENIIRSLNPVAKLLKTNYSKVDVKEVVNTKLFDYEKATTSAGWLQSLNEMEIREGFGSKNGSSLTPKPETEEYGINNFIYRSRKPFHPERLYNMIRDKFVVIERTGIEEEEEEEEEESTEDELTESEDECDMPELTEKQYLSNKRNSAFAGVLRSKGFLWLASRYIIRGEWSSAGSMLTFNGGIPWFAVTGVPLFVGQAAKLIERDMQGKHGDRRNEIVFIGINLDKHALTEVLDSCLVTDKEFKEMEEIIEKEKNLLKIEKILKNVFLDGFETWIKFDEEEDSLEDTEVDTGRVDTA
ncbi:CobW/HypB/UreG, nucleotide-binding domain-containing protein [Scheffersomyces xylosifermentans]|uniref:CobW/HypB/UreG, nucleotide-binding domain-containing protein n=1 Tax=Scheffersomyces xylosifermentans TaxID=1304137 RepID=UPI00315D0C1E